MRQARCLASDVLENVVDEGVHDSHGLGRDAGVQMDLLQHLVRVHGVALLEAALALLAVLLLGLGHSFFRAVFRGRSRLSRFRHVYNDNTQQHRKEVPHNFYQLKARSSRAVLPLGVVGRIHLLALLVLCGLPSLVVAFSASE